MSQRGFTQGLHLARHPERFDIYYSHMLLFREVRPELVVEKAEEFVQACERAESTKFLGN